MKIMDLLSQNGALIEYHDPYISNIEPHGGSSLSLKSLEMTDEELTAADCVLILTDHSSLDYNRIVDKAKLVVDTRNATKDVLDREKIIKI